MKTLMGGETEYAISARDAVGVVIPQETVLVDFLEHAKDVLGYSSVSSAGRFVGNGGLLYLDSGLHIECATPECTSPHDVVRFLQAGDAIVSHVAASLARVEGHTEVFCSRANVDYLSKTIWASHESYMHHVDPALLPGQLIPFLASRVVLTGAGGWDVRSPGLAFMLSPRASFITEVAGHDSQYVRPLFHTKDETLSETGSHRLHVACAESLCSESANVLRFGTTALVLALLEQGARPGTPVTLASPISAVQRFASDPNGRALATIQSGRRVTAVDIQRHYLAAVEQSLGGSDLPEWAESLCGLWRETLDSVARGPAHVDATLDWAIKRRLFARQLERQRLDWTTLPVWTTAVLGLRQVWKKSRRERERFDLNRVITGAAAREARDAGVGAFLARHALSWQDLPAFAAAREALLELDAKFSALGEDGVFSRLDRSGVLHHRVLGPAAPGGHDRPPLDTRARVRGDVIRRLSAHGTAYQADWTHVWDFDDRRVLDLGDPFETEERWQPWPGDSEAAVSRA